MVFAPAILILLVIIGYFLYGHYKLEIMRYNFKRKSKEFHSEWKDILEKNFPIYKSLSESYQERLLDYIAIFYHEKNWDKSFSPKSKVLESAKACLPILNRETNFYFLIKDINGPRDLNEWLAINENQFISEHGKSIHREFKGDFVDYSHSYFFDRDNLKNEDPKCFNYLHEFYNFML